MTKAALTSAKKTRGSLARVCEIQLFIVKFLCNKFLTGSCWIALSLYRDNDRYIGKQFCTEIDDTVTDTRSLFTSVSKSCLV